MKLNKYSHRKTNKKQSNKKSFNKKVKGGENLEQELIDACFDRDFDKVNELLGEKADKKPDKKPDVNYVDKNGFSVLHAACYGGNYDIIKLILKQEEVKCLIDNEKMTPLHYFCTEGIKYFYRNSDIDEEDVFESEEEKILDIVDSLIQKGCDVNAVDVYGRTCLEILIMKPNLKKMVYYLLEKGANVNIKNQKGEAPIHMAFMLDDYELFMAMMKKTPDNNIKDPNGNTLLQLAKKLKNRFIKDGVYEMREYKDFNVPIMIIPKGTLLFRSVYGGIDDFCGIQNRDDKEEYCLNKNYNVFFYPYPAYWRNQFKIFVVEKTLKIVNLINPSNLSRDVRLRKNSKYDFIKSCDFLEPEFCKGNKGRDYDPCFSEEFLKANPDIAGIISLARGDLQKQTRDYVTKLSEYSLFHKDNRGKMGVPELILYPKQTRLLSETNWSEQECVKEINNYSYLIDEKDYNIDILRSLLSHKGYTINRSVSQSPFAQKELSTIHVTIYNPLKMYVVWEYLEDIKHKKNCVPINWSAKSKLSQFQTDINKLNQGLYNTNIITLKKMLGMGNIFSNGSNGGKPNNIKSKRNKTRKKSNKRSCMRFSKGSRISKKYFV